MKFKPFLFLIGASALCNACATTQYNSTFSGFRHPALRAIEAMDPQPAPTGLRLEKRRPDLAQRCIGGFRHIALNRCERWLPDPVEAGSSHPALSSASLCDGDAQDCRLRLAQKARQMMRTPRYRVGGVAHGRTCSGFVLATLAAAEMPAETLLPPRVKGEGGVSLLHRMIRARGGLHQHKVPQIGDLVFFDNTHDRNRNGRPDDPLTHVGLVEKVDADGTITFIHHVERGVLRYKMNLFRPHERRDPKTGKVLNHYIRLGRSENGRRLTGELFNGFGTLIP